MRSALPESLRDTLAREGVRVTGARALGGGCISPVFEVQLSHGQRVFLKTAPEHAPGDALLEAEAHALATLRETGTIRVPAVLARGPGWLLLEWLEPGPGTKEGWRALGRALAALHRCRGASFGFERANFIGTLPQSNPALDDWAEFWWSARLEPQLELAVRAGHVDARLGRGFDRLRAALPAVLQVGQQEGASLLHGDLWGGNVQLVAEGEPAVIDPSCYRGHREVDLAMATLFGGFDPDFFLAYAEAWPLEAPGLPQRRAVYQLYYLLVHVNLFGAGYVPQTASVLREALG